MNTAKHTGFLCLILFIFSIGSNLKAQSNDTLSNWDSYQLEWNIYLSSSEIIINPDQGGINPSEHCFKVVTNSDPYNFIFSDFQEAFNFEESPVFRFKIKAPLSGGSVLLKFENGDNSSSEEIEKIPTPGEWTDLEFDFSEVAATDYTRMVIFFDFQGTNADQEWLLDDIIQERAANLGFESNLPLVMINTYGQEINNDYKISAQMGIVDNGPGEINHQFDSHNDFSGHIGIEIRGQSSQMFPKKAYAVETRIGNENLNVSLLGMPEENDWILYAPFTDKSMLRNYISFYLARKLTRYSTRTVFCELLLNNEYRGVYILMEKIKRDENRVNIATLNPDDTSGDELTGGYIVKVDKIDWDFQYGQDGWLSVPDIPYPNAMNITFQFVEPKADEMVSIQKNYIESYVSQTENVLTGNFFTSPENGYQKYINVGSFIDMMLLYEISKEVDKYRYSTYFFKEKDSDGGKLFAGPPWDFNLGYSNVDYWEEGNDYTGWLYELVESHEWSIMFWWKRLMEDPYFRDLAKTRWEELRADDWTDEKIHNKINSTVSYLDAAQARNYEKWPILGEYVWPNYDWQNNDYNDEVAYFSEWLFNRLHWIDNNIEGNTLYPAAQLLGNLPNINIKLDDDYFSRRILKKKYFELNGISDELTIDTVLYVNANTALMKVSGQLNGPAEISVTMKAKILNSFNDLTSSSLASSTDEIIVSENLVKIYSHSNHIFLESKQSQLLGNQLEVYSILGQQMGVFKIESNTLNKFEISLPKGIYICRYEWNNSLQSATIRVL